MATLRLPPLFLALALAAPCAALAAAPAKDAPRVHDAWARPAMGASGMSALYLEVQGGARDDVLVGASSPAAGRLELHRSEMKDGMMGMAPVTSVPVPAHGAARLAPGGLHIMVMDLKRPLKAGDHLPVTLRFAKAGAVTVDAPVRTTPPAR